MDVSDPGQRRTACTCWARSNWPRSSPGTRRPRPPACDGHVKPRDSDGAVLLMARSAARGPALRAG